MRFKPSLGYIDFIKQHVSVTFMAFIKRREETVRNGAKYSFFKGYSGLSFIPIKMLAQVKKEKADVIIVQGLSTPLQVIYLRLTVGKKAIIIAQHHGEQPLAGVRKRLQKIADQYINGYLFTSKGNAQWWIDEGMISSQDKCFEVLEASTFFTRQNREDARTNFKITGDSNYLWVGRLNENKDPLTALKAFEKYIAVNKDARLHMIYQTTEMLNDVKEVIYNSPALKAAVVLVGEVIHNALPYWYSAVDFYLSGSHREGSGYALIEAMACGCIPVVTDIPPFKAIMGDGPGFIYEKGNAESLLQALIKTSGINRSALSAAVMQHFKQNLSFKRIADNILQVCKKLAT